MHLVLNLFKSCSIYQKNRWSFFLIVWFYLLEGRNAKTFCFRNILQLQALMNWLHLIGYQQQFHIVEDLAHRVIVRVIWKANAAFGANMLQRLYVIGSNLCRPWIRFYRLMHWWDSFTLCSGEKKTICLLHVHQSGYADR